MTVTLCIETSGAHCSLALATSDKIYSRDRMLERSHNQHLLELLDELFVEAELKPVQVGLVAFGCGPGSFTGVRISAAAAQAIAVAAQAKVVPIASSWVLAASALEKFTHHKRVITSVRSRGNAYYLAAYERSDESLYDGENCVRVMADELVEALPEWVGNYLAAITDSTVMVGEAPSWLPIELHAHASEPLHPYAHVMVRQARLQHAKDRSFTPELALPTYIAGDSPWRKQ